MSISNLNEILERPLKSFSEKEQREIVNKGRFTDLTDIYQNDKGKSRMFSTNWYQRVRWLTGNTVNRKLYCWSCVLFPTGASKIWNSTGFDDLKNLSQSLKKHEDTKEHTYSTVKLKLFTRRKREGKESGGGRENNARVKRNREYLERLIDVAGALAKYEVPFRDGIDDGFYKCMMNVLKKYDDIVRSQIEDGSPFKGLTKTVQIDLMQSIAHVVRQRIATEVEAARFFALQVDELPFYKSSRQVAVSLRFIKEARPVERFVGLYEVGFGRKADELVEILKKELEIFNFKEKMIAQSFDGGAVKSTELYDCQKALKRLQDSPNRCQFIHCYAHEFSDILAQSLRTIHECKLFFSVVLQFQSFYRNPVLKDSLQNIDATCFDTMSSSVMNLRKNFFYVMRVLEYVSKAEEFENATELIAQACNLISHIKSYKFMVLVTAFHRLFTTIDASLSNLKNNPWDFIVNRSEINALTAELKQMKTSSSFANILSEVPNTTGSTQSLLVTNMMDLFVQIVDHVLYETEGRFLDIELAEFCSLVDPKAVLARGIPDNNHLTCIKKTYADSFDVAKLKTELELLYNDPSIAGVGSDGVTSVGGMLRFMYDNDINGCLPMLYRLLELVVTMPSSTEPLEGNACVLNRIKEYCKVERTEEPKSALALLCVERELFCEMEKSSQWYSQVIDHFSTLPSTSSIELVYRVNDDSGPAKTEVIGEPELSIKEEPNML